MRIKEENPEPDARNACGSRLERWWALAGLVFVALYIAAFALGIEVGDSDEEIRAYYASGSHRAKEIVTFFLIAGAALSFLVFAAELRSLIAKIEEHPRR